MGAVKVVVGTLIWSILILVLSIPLGLLYMWKLLVLAFFWRRRILNANNEYVNLHPLSSDDAIIAPNTNWEKPVINMGFALMLENGDSLTVQNLRDHFADTLLKDNYKEGRYDNLFSYLVTRSGYVFRATGSHPLNLDNHVKEVFIDVAESEMEFKSVGVRHFLNEWLRDGYKEDTPSWEMVLISQKSDKLEKVCRGKAVAFKIHHALADAYSILHILDKLTNNTSPYLVKDFKDSALTQFFQMLELPLNLKAMGGMVQENNPFRVQPSCHHEISFSLTSFPLSGLKEIRQKYNVRMASVIYTIISGGLRQFLIEERGEDCIRNMPDLTVGNTVAWPKHPSKDPEKPNAEKLCNHWAVAFMRVPLTEPNPVIRLRKIDSEFESFLKSGVDKWMKRILLPVMCVSPRFICLERKLIAQDTGIVCGLTSLVGGDNYSLLGCKVTDILPVPAIQDGNFMLPLMCFTFSHSGKMEVTFWANLTVFKDEITLDKVSQKLCHDEFNKLLKTCRG